MTMNLKGRMLRTTRQADKCLRKAQVYIAQIRATIEQDHPGLAAPLLDVLETIDHARHNMIVYTRGTFSRTTYKPHTRHRLAAIIRNTKPMRRDEMGR